VVEGVVEVGEFEVGFFLENAVYVDEESGRAEGGLGGRVDDAY
jgi:hypothetical protein